MGSIRSSTRWMRNMTRLPHIYKKMRHGRSETRLVAAQAFVDAGLHVFAHVFHRLFPPIEVSLRAQVRTRIAVCRSIGCQPWRHKGRPFDWSAASFLSATVYAGEIEGETWLQLALNFSEVA